MQELSHVVYRSPLVSISDITCQLPFGPDEYPLESGTLVFVRSGLFTGQIGQRRFVIDANYAVFGSDGDVLSALRASKTTCTCTCTAIRCSALMASGTACLQSKALLCSPAAYLMYARALNEARLARAGTNVDEAVAQLLCELRGGAAAEDPFPNDRTLTVCAIKELLSQSLSTTVSLPELADRFYLSPFTISRWFHKETGVSLRQYMQRLRLRRALTYMLDEKRSLTAIAIELGFYDEPHFSKAFHAEFGRPPALAFTESLSKR